MALIEREEELQLAAIFSTRAESRLEEILMEESFMVVTIEPTTTEEIPDELPNAPVVLAAEQELVELAAQQQEAQTRLQGLSQEQSSLVQEQQTLAARRAELEQSAQREARELAQAETEARHAATSPIRLKSATDKLAELRRGHKASATQRKKELTRSDERLAAITARLEALAPQIGKEQASLIDLAQQEGMVRTSRNNAFMALGEETYKLHAARLVALQSAVDEASSQLVEAQVSLREEKDATYVALTDFGGLREQARQEFALYDDAMTRLFDTWIALFDVLESEAPSLNYAVGQYLVARELALSEQDLDRIISSSIDRERVIGSHRDAAVRLKQLYLERK